MEGDISEVYKILEEQGKKIEQIFVSTEKTRKYFLWTMIISIALIILPVIGLFFVIPSFLSTYTDSQSLGL